MIYIEKIGFDKPLKKSNIYPESVLYPMGIQGLYLKEITILYGSNGCGKSTLLNLIAEKINCNNARAHINSYYDRESDTIESPFVNMAKSLNVEWAKNEDGKKTELNMPPCLIASNDVFSYISGKENQNRDVNEVLEAESIYVNRWQWDDNDGGNLLLKKMEKERRFSNLDRANIGSNGEEAYMYYNERIENDGIYLLDEPETSLSPIFQEKLAKLIYETSRYCGVQYIIATHSPFFLSLHGAKIINLDNHPATDFEKWNELENMKPYFRLFNKMK